MKLLFTLALLIIPISAHAQNNDWWKMEGSKKEGPSASQPIKSESKSARAANPDESDLKTRLKSFRNGKRFSVRYDRFRDETYVSVGPFFVGGTGAYVMSGFQLEMSAIFIMDRKAPTDTVYLRFRSVSHDWTFLKSRDLYALVDGERIAFGEGDHDSDIRFRGLSESLIFDIPIDTFIRLASATKAELKVGPVELTLKDEHKEAFRDLTSLCK